MYRDTDGFVDLNGYISVGKAHTKFIYNNEEYYFKYVNRYPDDICILNELVASELGTKMGLDCVSYDLAKVDNLYGVISKSFLKEDDVPISIQELLGKKVLETSLEEIWNVLSEYFKDEDVKNIMDKYTDMFLFSILIGNCDLNTTNLVIIENGSNVRPSPIFDNGFALANNSLYRLGVYENDSTNRDYILYQFLKDSDSSYFDRLNYFLSFITEENIFDVLNKIETKTMREINEDNKYTILESLMQNRYDIEGIIKKLNYRTK